MNVTKNTPVKFLLEMGNDCKRCSASCSFGSGYLNETDIQALAEHAGMEKEVFIREYTEEVRMFNTEGKRLKLTKEVGKPFGPCTFKGTDGNCKVHEVKPLYCKLTNHSEKAEDLHEWFMVHFFVNTEDPESVRQYAFHLKTGGKELPGASLAELIPNEKRLREMLDYTRVK